MKKRFLQAIAKKLTERAGIVPIDSLEPGDRDDLRIVARLFESIDRQPVFMATVDHVMSVLDEHFLGRPLPTLTRTLIASLLSASALRLEEMGRSEEAARVRTLAVQVRPDTVDRSIFYLLTAWPESQVHTMPPLVADAVARALLVEIDSASAKVDRGRVLYVAMYTSHATGNHDLLRRSLRQLAGTAVSDGYRVIQTLYEAQVAQLESRFDDRSSLVDRARELFATVARNDAAYELAGKLVQLEDKRDALAAGTFDREPSLVDRAAAAARRQDWPEAAAAYEAAMADQVSDAARALFRLFAEGMRLQGELLRTAADVRASLHRLATDHVARSRTIFDIDPIFVRLQRYVVGLEAADRAGEVVAEVVDFGCDVRHGVAIDHRRPNPFSETTAASDLAMFDLLTRDAEVLDLDAARARLAGCSLVWVSLNECDGTDSVVVTVAGPGSAAVEVRTTDLDEFGSRAVRRALGQSSEELTDDEVTYLSQLLFGDLSRSGGLGRVIVVPDVAGWELPWQRLAPEAISELIIAPSIAAALRMRDPVLPTHPRVFGIFDEDLPGAMLELRVLSELAEEGVIDFRRLHTIADLRSSLATEPCDLLTIATHGTTGDGFEYRMLIPDDVKSPAAILSMNLPQVVVLGCCWSARSSQTRSSIAASLGCLAAGSSTVIGGVWAIDDLVAAELLTRTYRKAFVGEPLVAAFRAAYLSLDPVTEQPQAAGLNAFGRL